MDNQKIKEQLNNNPDETTDSNTIITKETNKELEALQQQKKKRKKRKIGRIISNIVFTIIVLIIIFEAVIGIINMKKINDGEEPIWYLNTQKEEEATKIITKYNLGLYRIIKTDTDKDTRIVLKPFFIKD